MCILGETRKQKRDISLLHLKSYSSHGVGENSGERQGKKNNGLVAFFVLFSLLH
jgi:hypothetical protein